MRALLEFAILIIFLVFLLLKLKITSNNEICIIFLTLIILFILSRKFHNAIKGYWILFGNKLGLVVNPMILSGIFVIMIIPVAIISRLLGRDLLNLKAKKTGFILAA